MGLRVRPNNQPHCPTGVGAGPQSHRRGVNSFVRVGMGGDIVEEAVSGSEVKLGGVGLVRGELADGGDDGQI